MKMSVTCICFLIVFGNISLLEIQALQNPDRKTDEQGSGIIPDPAPIFYNGKPLNQLIRDWTDHRMDFRVFIEIGGERVTRELVRSLRNQSVADDLRRNAIFVFANLRDQALEALPLLKELMNGSDAQMRADAISAVMMIDPYLVELTKPPFLQLLDEGSSLVLGLADNHLKHWSDSIIGDLLTRLGNPNYPAEGKILILKMLGNYRAWSDPVNKELETVFRSLRSHPDERVRAFSAWHLFLAKQAPTGEVVQAFSGLLNYPDVHARIDATYWLLKLARNRDSSSAAVAAVPVLTTALHDADGSVRLGAASALAKIGPHAMKAVSELIAVLRQPIEPEETPPKINLWRKEKTPRTEAAVALGLILAKPKLSGESDGPIHPTASPRMNRDEHLMETVDLLVEIFKNPNESEFLREQIGWALGRIGPEIGEHLKSLIQIANAPRTPAKVRQSAGYFLTLVEPGRPEVILALNTILRNSEWTVVYQTIRSIEANYPEPEDFAPTVMELLDHFNETVRQEAVEFLGKIARGNSKWTQAVLNQLRSPMALVATAACEAVRSLDLADASAAIPELIRILKIENRKQMQTNLASEAVQTLGSFGDAATEALPAIHETLRENTAYYTRGHALEVLFEILDSKQEIADICMKALGDDSGWVRRTAWEGLSRMKPEFYDVNELMGKAREIFGQEKPGKTSEGYAVLRFIQQNSENADSLQAVLEKCLLSRYWKNYHGLLKECLASIQG